MNKKKVDSILKAATMAGVALGASAIVDADVVYAEELGSESTDSELYKQQSMTEATSDSLAEEHGTVEDDLSSLHDISTRRDFLSLQSDEACRSFNTLQHR